MKWSRLHVLIIGLVIVLATNAIALAGAIYNRSGAPGSVIELTERELLWLGGWGLARDNSGIEFRILWRVADLGMDAVYGSTYARDADWLGQDRLSQLGFDVSYPVHAEDAPRRYGRALPRSTLLVLELNGPAYEFALTDARKNAERARKLLAANPTDKQLKQDADYAQERLKQEEIESPRLFVVDAGLNWDTLRRKYPDTTRYAILAGRIRMRLTSQSGTPQIRGYVEKLNVDRINVPAEFRRVFKPMLEGPGGYVHKNRFPFNVTIAYGQRLEPWVTAASRRP